MFWVNHVEAGHLAGNENCLERFMYPQRRKGEPPFRSYM